ncbi:MAG: phosphatase PAP2 family protein [Eikenella sp.]|nr:phosphatase PAP2 family protein [Eikenella sp.]
MIKPHAGLSESVSGSLSPALPHARAFGLSLAMVFACLFALFYGTANALSAFTPWQIRPALPFEAAIPLLPTWAAVYLSMPLMLLWGIWRLEWTAQWRLFAVLLAELLAACLCFVLLPVDTAFPPAETAGFWQPLHQFAVALALERNHLPSLHMAFALTAALALQAVLPPAGRLLVWCWAALIGLSTLFTHQHHLLDLAAGMVLAAAAWHIVPPYACRPHHLRRIRLIWLLLVNQWVFARRHLRYGRISLLLAVQCLIRPRRGWLLMRGFVFLQAVDDVMDGDRQTQEAPADLAERLITAWQQGRFDKADDWQLLAAAFYDGLRHTADPDAARREAAELLGVMRDDRWRAEQAAVWPAAAIQAQHRRTFGLSLNLLLAALDSPLRAQAIPELVDALGWCSTMRDLREDLAAGIINIPDDIWRQLPADPRQDSSALQHPALSQWLRQERQHALQLLDRLAQRQHQWAHDPAGARMVRLFARSVRRFAGRRFQSRYPWLADETE